MTRNSPGLRTWAHTLAFVLALLAVSILVASRIDFLLNGCEGTCPSGPPARVLTLD